MGYRKYKWWKLWSRTGEKVTEKLADGISLIRLVEVTSVIFNLLSRCHMRHVFIMPTKYLPDYCITLSGTSYNADYMRIALTIICHYISFLSALQTFKHHNKNVLEAYLFFHFDDFGPSAFASAAWNECLSEPNYCCSVTHLLLWVGMQCSCLPLMLYSKQNLIT